jgi:transposase
MAYSEETRRALRSAYVYKALSLEAAAEQLGIGFGTASRWRRDSKEAGDDWDQARTASMMAGQGAEAVSQLVLQEFMKLFQSTIEELKADVQGKPMAKAEALSRLSDAYNKAMSAAAKSNPKLNKLSVAMEVLHLLANFIRDDYPDLVVPFLSMLEPFGEKISEVFG